MEPLDDNEKATIIQLFETGPTWDGNLVSKSGRDGLRKRGFADRFEGWNFITLEGVKAALALGLG